MSDLALGQAAMRHGEELIRKALALATPALRAEELMRAYRLGPPETQAALFMGLATRASVGRSQITGDQPQDAA